MVAKEGFSAYGMDIAPAGIELCKKMLDSWSVTANLSVGNMKKLNFADNFFDTIFDVVSMQHLDIEGHLQAYHEVFRCLKNGGNFFQWHLGANSVSFKKGEGKRLDEFTVDNITSSKEILPLHDNGMTSFLTSEMAENLLKEAGFKEINIETVQRTYDSRSQFMEYLAIEAKKP